jgi:hypothetical protein
VAFDPRAKLLIVAHNNVGKPGAQLGFFNLAKEGEPLSIPITDHVSSMALSRDGKTLAISFDRRFAGKPKLELWNVATFKPRTSLPADARKSFQYYHRMVFAPDGKTLAGAPFFTDRMSERMLDVLDLEGKISQEIAGRGDWAGGLTFSPDGKTLAVINANTILFVDPATGESRRPPGGVPGQAVKKEKKPREQNEAEKLFRAMEKKIKGAKALEIVFTYEFEGETAKGSLLLTNDNKARLRLSGQYYPGVKGNPTFELVSDGKRFKTKGAELGIGFQGVPYIDPKGQTTEGLTRKGLHEMVAAFLSQVGVGYTVLRLPYLVRHGDESLDPDEPESMYGFKAGAAEKVGERQAKVLRYRFDDGGKDDPEITLWIDAENGLPLKRVFSIPRGVFAGRITETYSEFNLDPKIDGKAFELPK